MQRSVEVIGMMWLSGTIIYMVRNVVELIPSPFNGFFGFDHLRLKELTNASVFSFIFLYFQAHLKSKIAFFYNNLTIAP